MPDCLGMRGEERNSAISDGGGRQSVMIDEGVGDNERIRGGTLRRSNHVGLEKSLNDLNSVRRRVLDREMDIGGATINDIVPSDRSRNNLGDDRETSSPPAPTISTIRPSTLSTLERVTTTVKSVAVNNPELAIEPNYTLSGIANPTTDTHSIHLSPYDH